MSLQSYRRLTVQEARAEGVGCANALFEAYGASYPDASCQDGRLQDDDETDYVKGDIPCPICRYESYARENGGDDYGVIVVPLGAPRREPEPEEEHKEWAACTHSRKHRDEDGSMWMYDVDALCTDRKTGCAGHATRSQARMCAIGRGWNAVAKFGHPEYDYTVFEVRLGARQRGRA